jgi:histone-lysine N-methyltransferase SETMAR
MLKISAGSIWKILQDLGLSKKAAHWVPRILKDDQKEARVKSCQEFLALFKDGKSPKFKKLVTGDETWFYNDDPETKIQSMIWSEVGAAPPKKARRSRSVGRTMFAIFFSINGIVASVPLEERATVTSAWYVEKCLPKVFEAMAPGEDQKKLFKTKFLHHDKALAHTAKKTQEFIGASGVNLVSLAPYSPDLAPCDFWLFPKIKAKLRGQVFADRKELISAVNHELSQLTDADFAHCYERWIYRLKKCVEIGGDWVERS